MGQVYDKIIRASGRENIFTTDIIEDGGSAVLLLAAAIMVWDIFTAGHTIGTTFRDAVAAASIGGGMLEDVVQAVVNVAMEGAAEEAAVYFALGVGILGGFAGGFIIGAFAGPILDLNFSSGGTATLSTQGIRCYVAPKPDGAVLACQISHNK